ncbi:MAG: IS1380 family transposase, partial [Proteobacteria bacterium]|nr:IS1380 family transposase [Pseudomonadota bacterium]
MMRQRVMPLKLERTEEGVIARSGLVLFGEFMEAMGVDSLIERQLPKPCSGRGYEPIRYIKPLSMMLYGGGEAIEDVREIREDDSLREVVGFEEVPSCSAIGDWLRRMGERGGVEAMERVNDGITKRVLRKDESKGYTLIIESWKREAQMTYLGCKGYR